MTLVHSSSPHRKTVDALRLFLVHVAPRDGRAAWALMQELDEPFDRGVVAFEHRLNGPVRTVRDPAADAAREREPPRRVTEEHALDTAVHDDALPDHGAYSGAVEFRELLKRRRMVRAYRPEPVPRELLERIVETIRRAPSAGFSQGQRFVVVTEPARKREVAHVVGEEYYTGEGFAPWISGAAALVVVCTREADYHERYRQPDKVDESGAEIEWPVPYWHVDAGKAAMLVLLAGIDEGLATGVFGVPAQRTDEFRRLVGLPDDVAVVEVITLGYPDADTASDRLSSRGTRPRKPLDELVRWERWA